ncbi:hypothetical protein diail_6573 [Diaporthe ilicicola]|nr:hypothetical protein diail_6573 [Diaporthe ilicicola]
MDGTEEPLSPFPATKPRIPYACEACRVAKVKCTPGNTPDICRRCSASKRECIFKTGPRKRRRRDKLRPAATRTTPPPSAPSKTFTIDVPMSGGGDADMEAMENFDALRDAHGTFLDDLVPEDDIEGDGDASLHGQASSSTSGAGGFSASTPSVSSRSVHELSSIQPQFNLDSATSLLDSFRNGMLPYFPVIILSADVTLPSLAKDRPFVLLAILAAASGGRSMQGHSLYDEEFRKVLGMKFVSGGERSLELLVGLLIYCAWHPFHLRPRQRQASQYMRMAADIVHDLELDQAPDDFGNADLEENEDFLAGWTATCCGILERVGNGQAATSDQSLAWLTRLANIFAETSSLNKRRGEVKLEAQHVLLMVKGLEAQLQEWQGRMPVDISSKPVIRIANLFTRIFLHGYSLLKFPYYHPSKQLQTPTEPLIEPSRLLSCANALRTWYDYISSFPDSEFANFSAVDWGNFVGMIVLGLRLSFPLPRECPSWDHAAAREIIGLGPFLERFTDGGNDAATLTPASSKMASSTDVLSASKVVLGVVKRKYEKRLAALERAALVQPPHPMAPDADVELRKCPMLDGSLDPYIAAWDDTFLDPSSLANATLVDPGLSTVPGPGFVSDAQPAVYHDLWATMTMGWSQDNFGNMGGFGDM